MGILETSLKNNDIVCSTPQITINIGKCTFKSFPPSWTFETPSIITISDNVFLGQLLSYDFKNEYI